jgi:long-chain acyl-CoA synthetase
VEGSLATDAGAPYASRFWTEHYPKGVPATIDFPSRTIWEALEDTVERYADRDAFVFLDEAMSYRRLLELSDRMASALAGAGVKRGDAVLLLLPNTPHFPISYFAALKLGAAVAAAPPNSVQREIDYLIRDSGARTIITLDILYEKVAATWQGAGVESVVVGTLSDFLPLHKRILGRVLKKLPQPTERIPYGSQVVRMPSFLASGREGTAGLQASPDDVAVLQYTGGTTGIPKAAMLTHASLLANARQMRDWFPQLDDGRETILAVLPLFHVYGMTLVLNAAVLLAARTVLIPNWTPSLVFESIRKYRPTIFPGVPSLYVAFINDERSRVYDVSSIEYCVCGGAPLPVEVKRDFERLTGGHLYEGYGLSEASPLVSAQPYTGEGEAGSVGLPVANTEITIVDADTGAPVPLGESGELLVRGPQVMRGYWHRPEETDDVLQNGWLRTGDIARMDERGFLFIVDRSKDLIITGGENVYPREIEEVLFEHPKIKEAAVVGVPHPFGGEVAKAFVVTRADETLTKAEVLTFARERLAKHKVPRAVEFRTDLPKSSTGKVLRRVLADEESERAKTRASRRRS